jgi:hypothetical protein
MRQSFQRGYLTMYRTQVRTGLLGISLAGVFDHWKAHSPDRSYRNNSPIPDQRSRDCGNKRH